MGRADTKTACVQAHVMESRVGLQLLWGHWLQSGFLKTLESLEKPASSCHTDVTGDIKARVRVSGPNSYQRLTRKCLLQIGQQAVSGSQERILSNTPGDSLKARDLQTLPPHCLAKEVSYKANP